MNFPHGLFAKSYTLYTNNTSEERIERTSVIRDSIK